VGVSLGNHRLAEEWVTDWVTDLAEVGARHGQNFGFVI